MATDWRSQGCEECRTGVLSGRWRPPYLVAEDSAIHARLHRCTRCQSWWEEGEREAHVIDTGELNTSWGHALRAMHTHWTPVLEYLRSGGRRACELEASPHLCEFWEEAHLERNNLEYEFPRYAPGFCGFASSGGGELLAFSPTGAVVSLPAIGMEPAVATAVAPEWHAFVAMLRSAA